MKIQLEPKEDLELSRKNIREAVISLEENPSSELELAVLNLLKMAVLEISYTLSNFENLDYASLHTRNIFETYLILLHIFNDENALYSWYGQIHKDSEQVRFGFRKLLKRKGMDTSSLDEVTEFENQALSKSLYKSERNFNIYQLAKTYGHEEDYDFLYKLSSKLVHPSSIKVNFYETFNNNQKYIKVIIHMAMYFSQKIEKFCQQIHEKRA